MGSHGIGDKSIIILLLFASIDFVFVVDRRKIIN